MAVPKGAFLVPWGGEGQGDAGDPGCRAEPSTRCLLCPPRTAGAACLSLAGDTQARGVSLTLRCGSPIPGRVRDIQPGQRIRASYNRLGGHWSFLSPVTWRQA